MEIVNELAFFRYVYGEAKEIDQEYKEDTWLREKIFMMK